MNNLKIEITGILKRDPEATKIVAHLDAEIVQLWQYWTKQNPPCGAKWCDNTCGECSQTLGKAA